MTTVTGSRFRGLRWPVLILALCALTRVSGQPLAMPGDVDGDGDVDRNDTDIIMMARNTPATGPADPRDLDHDGTISVLDARIATLLCTRPNCAVEPAQLGVDVSPTEITMLAGTSVNLTTTVSYITNDAVSRSTVITQTVTPPVGIAVTPAITGGFTSNSTFANVDSQTIFASQLGTYEIRTTASIASVGVSKSAATIVTVVESLDNLQVQMPIAEPGALPLSSLTEVLLSTQVDGYDPSNPPMVELEGVTFALNVVMDDTGTDPDLTAADGVYTARVFINSNGLGVGQCRTVRAVANGHASPDLNLCATSLPLGSAISDLTNPLHDPTNNQDVVRDEILIVFKPGVSETRMQEIVAGINGAIVGSIPEIGALGSTGTIVQVHLNAPPATFADMTALLASLKTLPEVSDATPNVIGKSSEVTPNDPRYPTQYALPRVRADEAWVIARGAALIAVLDTGVDYNHPDLTGKVLLGRDFVNGDNDPRDDHGHGTHVAGIAAARTNNAVGIAGASWNSNILAVKILAANGGGTNMNLNLGLIHAVARGARIINLSLQNFGSIVCLGVDFARFLGGRLVVSAAGNNASSALNYPGACAGSLAIGNTTSTDGRSPSSNFGTWVDMAAPGHLIISTMPTYNVTLNNPPSNVPMSYGTLTGTSMAAPLVAGSAAVILSRRPGLTAAQLEQRLTRTAFQLPAALQLGAGRLDLFEAVFDASFEDPNMPLWSRIGTANSVTVLGPIRPQHPNYPAAFPKRPRMAFVSTGPAGDQVSGSLTQSFTIQPGVANIPMRLTYTFVSEEFPEWVGTIFDDAMRITLLRPNGTLVTLAETRVNTAAFVPIAGINFPGGDNTTGWTTWRSVLVNVPVTQGPGTYRIFITDAGDDIYDSVVLVDNIAFK